MSGRSVGLPRKEWWLAFALFALVGLLWSLATPLLASPDENDHVSRAASVARGEIVGDSRSSLQAYQRIVTVPRALALDEPCFAHRPSMTPACVVALPSGPGSKRVSTAVALDPPTFYAVVGLPSLLTGSTTAIRLMRLVSVLISAALLASALQTLRTMAPARLAAAGLAFALTPMTVFLSGTVNPNGVENCAAIAVWVSAALLVHEAARRVDPALVRRTGIAMIVLTLSRGLSPFWLAVIGGTCLALGTREGLHALVRSRVAQRWSAAVVGVSVLAVLWTVFAGPLGHLARHGEDPGSASLWLLFVRSFGRVYGEYREAIGVLGWLDTSLPSLVHVLWTVALGALVCLGVALGSRRVAIVVSGLVAASVLVPVVIDVSRARDLGLGWQGRWTLPLAAGVPIVAALGIAWSRHRQFLEESRLPWVLAACFFVAQFLAFAQALRRYTVGANGSLAFFVHPKWSPPLPPIVLLAAAFVSLGALTLWIWWPSRADVLEVEGVA